MPTTMTSLIWHGDRVAVERVPVPEPRDGWVLVDVAYTGVCGTDLAICEGKHPRAKPPLTIGHEIVGRLRQTALGLPVGHPVAVRPLLSCGRCDACLNGLSHICTQLGLLGIDAPGSAADQVLVQVDCLVPLDTDADLRRFSFTEPLAVAVHAVHRSGLALGDVVLVVGAGPIGRAIAACAALAGGRVFMTDAAPVRRTLAAQAGWPVLDHSRVLEELAEHIGPKRAAVVFDAAAHPSVAARMTDWVESRGTIVQVGIYEEPPAVDLRNVVFREISLRGSRVYTRHDFATAVDLIASGRFDPTPLITEVVSLDEGPGAIDRLREGSELKVLIRGAAA